MWVDLGNDQTGWLPKDVLQSERPRLEELMRQLRAAGDVAGRRKWAERAAEMAPLNLDAQRALLSVLNEQGDTAAAARVQTMIDAVQKGTLPPPTDEPRLVMMVYRDEEKPSAVLELLTGIPGSAENMPQGIATRVGKPYLVYTLEGKRVGYTQVDHSETHECGFSDTYTPTDKAIAKWPARILIAMNTELPAQAPPKIHKPSSPEKAVLLELAQQASSKLTKKRWVIDNLKVADVQMLDYDGDGVEDAVGQYYAYSPGKKLSFALLMFAKGGNAGFSPEFTSFEEGKESGPDDVFDTHAREYHLRVALDFDGDGVRELVFNTSWDEMTYKRKSDGKWVRTGESAAKVCD